MYGASLARAFNFCDAFWQISLMCLINFNLQSKVMPSSFSLRVIYVQMTYFERIKVLDNLKVDDIYRYLASEKWLCQDILQ